MSCLFGKNGDIFFPKLSEDLHLITFAEIAEKYLHAKGLNPFICESEDEARSFLKKDKSENKWPCLFTKSDTTGEKDFEEFFTENETLELDRFENLGIVKNRHESEEELLEMFLEKIKNLRASKKWSKEDIIELFHKMIKDFNHKETGKYLDAKM
jgi:FlaA1/EpsC-like NDP-sugar epimerase